MNRGRWIIGSFVSIGFLIGPGHAFAQRDEMPAGYPQSLESDLQMLLGRLSEGPSSPGLLVGWRRRLETEEPQIRSCQTFRQLRELIKSAAMEVPKIGELTVYDTAVRIGAKLALAPQDVYLHAGTKKGAVGSSGGCNS